MSSMISFTADTNRMNSKGSNVVYLPVGDTVGICWSMMNSFTPMRGRWVGEQSIDDDDRKHTKHKFNIVKRKKTINIHNKTATNGVNRMRELYAITTSHQTTNDNCCFLVTYEIFYDLFHGRHQQNERQWEQCCEMTRWGDTGYLLLWRG